MDLESEQFMTLLTDALRAGPGSPEWHQAVGVLKTSGAAGADEYQMLVRAREDLESGRDYRAVRAGTGFTRKVLQGIEEEGSGRPRGLPSANLIAIIAALVILVVVVGIAVSLVKNTPAPPQNNNGAVEQLRGVYFTTPVAQWSLNAGGGAGDVGPEWRLVGEVPLRVSRGNGLAVVASTQPTTASSATAGGEAREYRAGAIVLAESVPADQARLVDATLKATRATDALIAEVFVAEGSPDDAHGSGGREVVWQLKGGAARVALADGRVPVQGEKIDPRKPQSMNVKVRFNKDTVIVESGEERLYEGPHKLAEGSPRYLGVRFRRKAGDASDGVWLTGINVLKP